MNEEEIERRTWPIIMVGLAFLAVFGTDVYRWLSPASLWFTVEKVQVFDAKIGEVPVMDVERTIHKPFHAEWIVEIQNVTTGKPALVQGCPGKGENDYRPQDKLPVGNDLNLDWWIWPTKCKLPKGKYRLDTLWNVDPGNGYPIKPVRNSSNVFEIG